MAGEPFEPLEEGLARAREREERFGAWLERLRASEPAFAEASALYPADMGEWQSAVYLLSGCGEVWTRVGAAVCEERSLAPVISELEDPSRAWSSSEEAVMRWAVHFWDVDRRPTKFPYTFEPFYFHRWITALHLRQSLLPALTITETA
jgi:hypothetical protein